MKKIAAAIVFLMIFVGCNETTLPDLPDMEESVDVDSFDIGNESSTSDDDEFDVNSSNLGLLLATVGGYNVPFSGKVFYSKDENFATLKEISTEKGMGSSSGSDITLAVWPKGFVVVGRYDSSTLYFFQQNQADSFEVTPLEIASGTVPNLQDAVYIPKKDEFLASALNSSKLFVVKNSQVSELKISDSENASPSKMKVVNNNLFVALLNLNEQWKSEKGEIAVINLDDYSIKRVELPTTNPTGKIEYNPNVDRDHIYFVTSGDSQKRDGAILRMDINSYKIETILSESTVENSLLDGDFVDLSLSDEGDFYIIFANNSSGWVNNLLKFSPAEGVVSKIDSNLNASAANPIDFSSAGGKIYYFVDIEADTYLKSLNTKNGKKEQLKLSDGPAAIKIWLSDF